MKGNQTQLFTSFLIKKTTPLADKSAYRSLIKSMSNQKPADELHIAIIRKFIRRKIYSSFKDNI